MEGNIRNVEINSLSVQPADPRDPKSILIPKYVTEGMLERGQRAIAMVEEHLPNVEVGLSLHLGAVIEPNRILDSNISVTSIDTPSIAYPSETVKQIISRPLQIPAHLAWRLNSAVGINEGVAQERREEKVLGYGKFLEKPFLRISVGNGFEKLISKIPTDWNVAVEYDSEGGMSVDGYLRYIKELRKRYPKLGVSLDLAHLYEFFVLQEGKLPTDAKEATINAFTNILKNPNESPILTVDINNVPEEIKSYGETHQVFTEKPAINIPTIIDSYQKYLRENTRDGRLCIEPSPRDYEMFVGREGACLLQSIRKFTE